jgi:hypothetical protein
VCSAPGAVSTAVAVARPRPALRARRRSACSSSPLSAARAHLAGRGGGHHRPCLGPGLRKARRSPDACGARGEWVGGRGVGLPQDPRRPWAPIRLQRGAIGGAVIATADQAGLRSPMRADCGGGATRLAVPTSELVALSRVTEKRGRDRQHNPRRKGARYKLSPAQKGRCSTTARQ